MSDYDRTKTAAMSLDAAEKVLAALQKEVKEALLTLQTRRGHFKMGLREDPEHTDDWKELDDALRKAEGPLTGALRALQGH